MPEGPSIVILKEEVSAFRRRKVITVSGNTKVDKDRALGQTVQDFKSWGKHFLICFRDFTIKIHFLLFGSYRINEERTMAPRLTLQFKNGVLNFYACSVQILEGDLDELYDWPADVMSDVWDPKAARRKLREHPEMLVCDALLDQTIFAGSGNIIKNEVMFRIKVHPQSRVGALPPKKLTEMITEVRNYSFDFLGWKKAYVLRKHWLAHTKQTCARCQTALTRAQLGRHRRRTFFCERCQRLYE
ncbi:MAG TPA: hypothetical protein VFG20_19950 [Planctomycetaceae bacterium]|nr:hypothetical protein [Planctomycetaceae bacterium]